MAINFSNEAPEEILNTIRNKCNLHNATIIFVSPITKSNEYRTGWFDDFTEAELYARYLDKMYKRNKSINTYSVYVDYKYFCGSDSNKEND